MSVLDREREAVLGLAVSQLPNADEVRADWGRLFDVKVPELAESLATLAELTSTRSRVSQRTFALQLLAKAARNRGTDVLGDAQESLRDYVRVSIEEVPFLNELRSARVAEQKREVDREQAAEREQAAAAREKAATLAQPVAADELVERAVPMRSAAMAMRSAPEEEAALAAPPRATLLPDDDPDPDVQAVFRGLNAAAATTTQQGTAWQVFSQTTQDTLQLTDDELALPQCTDDKHVLIGGRDSTRVVTWFSTAKPAVDFEYWTDPRRWDFDCHLFYESVKPVNPIPDTVEEYSEEFIEVVRFSPTKTLTTPLVFTRTVMAPDLYAVHFALPQNTVTDDILVDSGSLIARHDPDLPAGHATQITAEKCIAFKDPAMASWPTMCCDLFWTELTITVALGCAQHGP